MVSLELFTFAHGTHMAPEGTIIQETFRHAHWKGLARPLTWTVSHTKCLQVCATLLFFLVYKTSLVPSKLSNNPPTFPLL